MTMNTTAVSLYTIILNNTSCLMKYLPDTYIVNNVFCILQYVYVKREFCHVFMVEYIVLHVTYKHPIQVHYYFSLMITRILQV